VDDDSRNPDRPRAATRRGARRALRWVAALVALVLVLAIAAVALVLWAVQSTSGSAWLVRQVPNLVVTNPSGTLLGDFAADRIEIVIPGSGTLRLDKPRWQSLAAERGDHGRWLHLRIAALHADRATWIAAAGPASSEPPRPPASLRVPVEIEIGAATIDELRFGDDDQTPLRALRARVHLGAEGGGLHRIDDLGAERAALRASGSATIASDPPFKLAAHATLAPSASSASAAPAPTGTTPLPWQALIDASGPLDRLDAKLAAQVPASAGHAAQSVDARAVVRPFAAWPLGALEASTRSLDLAVFASGLPTTAISGRAFVTTSALDQPALVELDLANAIAGRWNEGRLPVVRVEGRMRARPDAPDAIDVESLLATLGSSERAGGRVVARGGWHRDTWTLAAELDGVRPAALDARAPDTSLAGTVSLAGSGFAGAPEARAIDAAAQLAAQLADPRLPRSAPRNARLRVEGRATTNAIELRSAEASLGTAKASASGKLARAQEKAPWRATGKLRLVELDPLPWWPGAADALLARGPSRLNLQSEFDVVLPADPAPASVADALAATRGKADVRLAPSTLAGVAVEGNASLANSDGRPRTSIELLAAGNRASGRGRLAPRGGGDEWEVHVAAPALDRLAPWCGAARRRGAPAALAGALEADGRVFGRWPTLRSEGELHATALRHDALALRRAEARWQISTSADAPLEATIAVDGIDLAGRAIEHAMLRLAGTAAAHRGELRIDSAALPPAWADTIATATAAPARAPSRSTSAGARSVLSATFEGGLVAAGGEPNGGWRGSVRELVARSSGAPVRTWLRAENVGVAVAWAGAAPTVRVEPGVADALGATLRWSAIDWRGGANPRLDVHATVDPMPVAPLLRAAQPDFGWGGDLTLGARIDVRSAPDVVVDIVVERAGGDLTVTDEVSTSALGFTDLRLGIAAQNGVWNFTAGVAGTAFGVASAAVVARTGSSVAWPSAATPIEGVLELRVARLGAWGTWLPAGWRLEGELHASAQIGGRFGAPAYTGHIEGSHISARNFLQGVSVSDGSVAIALEGNTARIEHFTAKGGDGTVRLEGSATFGEAPVAQLSLVADRFRVLGRVDRRIVASGRAALRLDATTIALDGAFKVDEGLIDFSRSDAPTLGDDVEVVRRPRTPPGVESSPGEGSKDAPAAPTPAVAPAERKVALDLRVDMGEQLRVRGRGLDAGLRGELRLTSPGGRLAVAGTLRTVDGTYQAYGQKLAIDRGVLTFSGPVENPRLDIEASRPDLDVRVGVLVTGTALVPRIRLFSDPEMSDLDKLSWLVMGRASDTTSGADTALLQRAALALLSGEGPGVTDRLIHSIGLDSVGIRQGEGDVKDTIVSLGKQISKRWYVGYERGLNATSGSWQLVYRIAQRLTVRAQAGGDNAIDLTWTLRWN
jgi:translocation and assembly module TamB